MQIDHISVNDFFWIRFSSEIINFGSKKFDEQLHFTISFNESSSHINFHITKNISDTKELDKPTIRILEIEKSESEFLLQALISSMIIPLDEEFMSKHKDLLFFDSTSFERLPTYQTHEKALKEKFEEISKVRQGSRLKIKGDVEKRFNEFLEHMGNDQTLKSSLFTLESIKNSTSEMAVLLEDKAEVLIKIQDKWFRVLPFDSFQKQLEKLSSKGEVNTLKWYFLRSIVRLKRKNSKDEISKYNTPILIEKRENKFLPCQGFFFFLYKNKFHFSSATPCLSISARAIVKNKSDRRLM